LKAATVLGKQIRSSQSVSDARRSQSTDGKTTT